MIIRGFIGRPECPYCREPAYLTHTYDSIRKSRRIWACRKCDARVNTHPNSVVPMGTLANAELRRRREQAHDAFDPLWRSGRMTRGEAYQVMQVLMGKSEHDAHIAMLTLEECERLIRIAHNPDMIRRGLREVRKSAAELRRRHAGLRERKRIGRRHRA